MVKLYNTGWLGERITICDSCICAVTGLIPEKEKVSLDLAVGSFLMGKSVRRPLTLFGTIEDAEL